MPTRTNPDRHVESLENRTLLSITWVNEGNVSDQFVAVFGADAATARGVVNSAIDEWNRVVTGYHGEAFDVALTVRMNPDNPATSAVGGPTGPTDNGVPITGRVTINTAGPIGQSQWYLDPDPDDHSEFAGDLIHAFARNPTPGGPADGMRDLRTILIHEIGHVMGINSGSPLIYDNFDVINFNTNLPDASTAEPDDRYWIFQGPSVNSLMTTYDILAGASNQPGHNAMPRAGNPVVSWGAFDLYSAVDIMQPTSLSVRRVLLTEKTSLMLRDMGYDVTPPETFGTFHAQLNADTGILTVRGGNDNTQINFQNQGTSNDQISVSRVGGQIVVSVDLGVDVPGTGPGLHPQDQQGAFVSRFDVDDVRGVRIYGLGGDDQVTCQGNLSFLDQGLTAWGGAGNDTLSAALVTNGQAVTFHGEAGTDSLTGGPGHDDLFGGDATDTLRGNGGNDDLIAGNGNDDARGGSGNDYLLGGDGNDVLSGNAGADTVYGNRGADLIIGGSILVSLQAPAPPDGADVLAGNEDDDVIHGDNVDHGSSVPLGLGGNDLIRGGDGDDTAWGGLGNDTVYGELGNDTLNGLWGDDRLYGDDGNDEIHGGDGADLIYGLAGLDELFGDAGDDRAFGGLNSDTLHGGANNDLLVGGTGYVGTQDGSADTVLGDDGDDTLYGDNYAFAALLAGGNDLIRGGVGNDTAYGGLGRDLMEGEVGSDTLWGEDGDDLIRGGEGNDLLRGQAGNDVMIGDVGRDELLGAQGRDILIGGRDQDLLGGSDQQDILIAGGTAHDANNVALNQLRAEWASARTYAERVSNLRGVANPTFPQRLNANTFLRSAGGGATVFADGVQNVLRGEADFDWFFRAPIDVTDQAAGEAIN